jgi:pimeloyl-ACP methyl ester carboxylesterase
MATGRGETAPLLGNARWTAIDGMKIRYIEDGRRSGPDTLMLAPSPSGLELFATIWPGVVESARVVAVEFPALDAWEQRPRVATPRGMAAFVIKVIEAFRLRHPHLAAADELMATALFTALDHPGALESLILSKGVVSGKWRDRRDGDWTAFEAAEASAWPELEGYLGRVQIPTLIISDRRQNLGPHLAEQLSAKLPKCNLIATTDDASNGREAPPLFARLIDDWVSGGYRSVPLKAV